MKHAIHSKINDERVYIDYSFRVSSTALLCWISEIWKKKKNQKTAKTYTKAQTLVTVFEHVTDENNDMTPSPNFVAS